MKNILMLILIVCGIGLVASCASESAKKSNTGDKKEMTAKKNNANKSKKSAKKGAKKSTYSWAKFWKSADRKMDLTDTQLRQLQVAKKNFDNKVKALGKTSTKAAINKLRNDHHTTIKKVLGDTKGEQFINYERRYKKKMRSSKK